MSNVHETLEGFIADFIAKQHVFFVATAASDGLVNVSPKGGAGTFAVIDDRTVAYLDLTGSGAETVAHVAAQNRVTLMWCAFEGQPLIVRIHGTARVVVPADGEWDALSEHFVMHPGARAIVVVTAERISDSCGMSVPEMTFTGHRDALDRWATGKGPDGLAEYWDRKNRVSLDGLPALPDRAAH